MRFIRLQEDRKQELAPTEAHRNGWNCRSKLLLAMDAADLETGVGIATGRLLLQKEPKKPLRAGGPADL